MMALQKVREFSGVARLAPANIEARSTETALKDATYAFEMQMLDLKNEFVHREAKLREEYLNRINQIASGE